jgi:hypothetical protein
MSCAAVRLPLRDSDRLIETVKSTTGRPIEIENEICIDLMDAVTLSSRVLLIGVNLCCCLHYVAAAERRQDGLLAF